MNGWEVCDTDEYLMCNLFSGTYMGCSLSDIGNTRGRLFTGYADVKRPISYHCIAWEEL